MTIGQLLFKQASNFFNTNINLTFLYKYLLNPWFYAAVLSYGISTFVWVKILTQMKISVAYPILSISYILTAIGAYYFFQERLTVLNLVGIFLIMVGVTLVSIK